MLALYTPVYILLSVYLGVMVSDELNYHYYLDIPETEVNLIIDYDLTDFDVEYESDLYETILLNDNLDELLDLKMQENIIFYTEQESESNDPFIDWDSNPLKDKEFNNPNRLNFWSYANILHNNMNGLDLIISNKALLEQDISIKVAERIDEQERRITDINIATGFAFRNVYLDDYSLNAVTSYSHSYEDDVLNINAIRTGLVSIDSSRVDVSYSIEFLRDSLSAGQLTILESSPSVSLEPNITGEEIKRELEFWHNLIIDHFDRIYFYFSDPYSDMRPYSPCTEVPPRPELPAEIDTLERDNVIRKIGSDEMSNGCHQINIRIKEDY